ncbi:unnamed protein product [Rotaria sp. Silwood2]|nr:unnamed protein product [Rotaria sp. Silwood2]CAF2659338.1 unnamed protein product [Rotaria sp. Silwood2]CAF3026633.1 unnamed protein product [Rotaria sp. Silwood2]CAF3894931.1 unnamed protein product [Rotaria sp. Silwood2]CAF4070054.1 unnamed protein product [Rotaria sp. Silwood2]
MSFEWTSQPLSIKSIAAQYSLPVAIRSAPGFRGSTRPIILHSISRITFAFGRALRASKSATNGYVSYAPVDSEIVAIPLKYPGYFECLPSHNIGQLTGVSPEKSIQTVVERMQLDHRPQTFYIASPMRVYTVETNDRGVSSRIWHNVEAHQIILFNKLVHVEYTPTINDNLTDDDYEFSWWFCFGRQILNRNEYALKCRLSQQQKCYVPCSSTDEVNLIPVGQHGSTNVNKLQTIYNLIEQFPTPLNIKLAQLPGSYTHQDFSGSLQVFGSHSEEFAVCASLTSSHIAVIPKNTPLKFVVSPLSSLSSEIRLILSRCQMFVQSFDMQIRRILVSSHHNASARRVRSRNPKTQAAIENHFKQLKRSCSADPNSSKKDDQATNTTDEGYRSGSSATNKRYNYRKQRAVSFDLENSSQHTQRQRRSSTGDNEKYNLLSHHVQKNKESSSSSPPPPALPKKPPNFPYPTMPFTYDSGSNIIEDIDSSNADGSIVMDSSHELFLALPSHSRFT